MYTYSYKIGAALLALVGATSTDTSANICMPVSNCNYAYVSVVDTRSDGLKQIPNIGIAAPKKKNYRERYKRFTGSKMYESAYKNRSLGEVIVIED